MRVVEENDWRSVKGRLDRSLVTLLNESKVAQSTFPIALRDLQDRSMLPSLLYRLQFGLSTK